VVSAQEATLPAKSSFIIKLANEAIVADGTEDICNHEQSRSEFANAFLGGYSTPDSTVGPPNLTNCTSRMNVRGWDAGRAYRRAHPESVADIMREYGYKKFEGAGVWTVGFEAGGFQPDGVPDVGPTSPGSCWYLAFIHSAELDSQLERTVSTEARLHGATLRVHVRGYVSPLGGGFGFGFGHFGACQRQLYAVSVSADAA
jgi:hypothetical protein